MPMNPKDYDPQWKAISKAAIERAGHKCEMCYAPNGDKVYRYDNRFDYPWSHHHQQLYKYRNNDAACLDGYYVSGKLVKIVLTVHHIDGDKHNNHPANLLASCQKCHLRLDKMKHIKNREATRQRRIDSVIPYGRKDR